MKHENIKIRYCEGEYGWAEPLGGRLARIVNQPILAFDELWRGDIVRIQKATDDCQVCPVIAEVVETRYPCRSYLDYQDESQLNLLRLILAPLGATAMILTEPEEGDDGVLIVAHGEGIDAALLAEGVGIPQCGDEGDDDEDGEDGQPAGPDSDETTSSADPCVVAERIAAFHAE